MARPRILRAHRARIAWTNTSRVPDDEVIAALRALARELPGALDGYVVRIKSTRVCGRGWHHHAVYGSDLPAGRWRGTISVMTPPGSARWLDTLAHEAKHAEQRTSGTYDRQRQERQLEHNARAFAAWFVEQHRQVAA